MTLDWREIPGWFGENEAALLQSLARDVRPNGTIVEIGSYRGRSTVALAQATAEDGAAGQSQTWMIPPSQWANALADIYQTYQLTGTANARIIPPTAYGFAQASIYAINVTAKGQSRVAVKAFNIQKYAQARGIIIKKEGYGQAKAHIFKPRAGNITGLARAVVGIHPYWPTGQAYFWLRRTYHDRLMGQANALIRRSESYARAGALTLHLGYKGYGQAFVVWE